MTARMQKSGVTGHTRAERSMGLLEEKRCPQTGTGEPGVRSPGQEEERGVQSHGRDFPPSCGFCVESLSGNTTQIGPCLGRKAKELQTSLCSLPKYGSLFSYGSSFFHWEADFRRYIRCIALLFFHF